MYVDGYVLPVPKKNLVRYKKMAAVAGKVWLEHGALQFCETAGEDLKTKFGVPFSKLLKLKAGETAVFSWICFKSRKHRDKVNAAVMKDPRLGAMMSLKDMPFDMKRMAYGGFTSLVDL
ncbi:MAG: DUF1428 domain-containing protein [Phycisphaerales bacterium]|nr:DUF1428 domain-containing protein [Planctomycetota bacterium]